MNTCIKHPKYKGKKIPKHQCVDCLNLYWKMHTPRIPIKPTRVIKDKTKYTRRSKHKKDL